MRVIVSCSLVALMGLIPAQAAQKAKPQTTAQLQAQIKKLTAERDALQDKLDATQNIQQDLAAAERDRKAAVQEAEGLRKELQSAKTTMLENRSGAETLLNDLRTVKADLAACQAEKESLNRKLGDATKSSTLVESSAPNIILARPLNLNRVTPSVGRVKRGVVVVNVLVSENGEVLDTRLVQGLPGEDVNAQKANEACLDAAKRVVFDPARAADGKTRLRVWQAVGFMLD